MKLTIEQGQLLRSLQMVERAVNERSALPVLANVLLETTERELVLTATDLDVGVRYRLPLGEPAEQGAVTIPARRLTTIVRELPPEPILVEAKSNHTATLTCGASRFRIPGLPPEDFPIFPAVAQAKAVTISQPALKSLVGQTAFAMSMEETRFILNGALVKAGNGAVTLAATDGRRLAVASAAAAASAGEPFSVVVPAKTMRELGRLLNSDEDAPVNIALLKDNQLFFEFGAVTMITRLIEGQFPPYESVIPAPAPLSVTCSRALLTSAVRRASLMTTATSQAVVFELDNGKLVVVKESADVGSAREELEARYTGGPMSIAFNPEFWLDVLKVLEGDDVTIELTGPDKPAVVRLPDFVYVVIPMKLA